MKLEIEKLLWRTWKSKIGSTKGKIDRMGNPIEMRISFEEWCRMWSDAGRLPGLPFVVSRNNDIGHYSVDNVKIQHNKHNMAEAIYRGGAYSEYEYAVTELAIKYSYSRKNIQNMIKRGELVIQ